MLPPAAVFVSDAHLGFAPREDAEAFHRFLATVPHLGEHLVINGDLFEFFFAYRSVIPRVALPTIEALRALKASGVRITLTGGNHDRWGNDFWGDDLGIAFHPVGVELQLAGFTTMVRHGDGVGESHWTSKVMHAVTRRQLTATLYRWIHPDLGLAMVRRLSPHLAGKAHDPEAVDRAARQQRSRAETILAERPDIDVLVLGHTHRSQLVSVGERRWFLNPGAWVEGYRYARLTEAGPVLEQFAG